MITSVHSRCLLLAFLTLAPTTASSQQAICPGGRVSLDTSSSLRPFVQIRLGNREGKVAIDTGSNRDAVEAQTFGLSAGKEVRLKVSGLPTFSLGDFIVMDMPYLNSVAPGGRGLGIIGTPFLSLRFVEFHYEASQAYMIVSTQSCSSIQLDRAGLVSISQQGFYTADPKRLPPQRNYNRPVIFIRIGSVIAPALIDSGGAFSGAIQINALLFQRLRESGISLQQVATGTDTDCKGNPTNIPVYQPTEVPVLLATHEGKPVFNVETPLLMVEISHTCGVGISKMSEPFAIIGAEYLKLLGTVIFDGLNEKVWVRKLAEPELPKPGVAITAQVTPTVQQPAAPAQPPKPGPAAPSGSDLKRPSISPSPSNQGVATNVPSVLDLKKPPASPSQLAPAATARGAGTVCTNGQCVTCDGSLACVNGNCTCNGTPATSINVETGQGPCGAQETVAHGNGGGRVATTASVDLSVYVSGDSAVCGRARVAGVTRLVNGSLVNGRANVSGESILTSSTINGTATIFDSTINQSTVNGNARVIRSELLSSTVNGRAAVESSSVTDSVLNGNASVVGRQVHGAVLNN